VKVIILIVSLLLSGCASSYYVEDYNSQDDYYSYINRKTFNEEVALEVLNGKIIKGNRLFINKDVSSIYLADSTRFEVKTDSVHQVILVKHGGGLFYGLLIGLGTGYLAGKILYSSNPEAGLSQLFIVALGTVVGGGIGYLVGDNIKFELNKKEKLKVE